MRSTHLYSARTLFAAIAIGMAATAGGPALAQVAPTAAEAAAYTGLHAAAQKGDVAKLDRLAAANADLNARDGNGRTPLHVAVFAGQREAIKALVKRGVRPTVLRPLWNVAGFALGVATALLGPKAAMAAVAASG